MLCESSWKIERSPAILIFPFVSMEFARGFHSSSLYSFQKKNEMVIKDKFKKIIFNCRRKLSFDF